MEDDDSTENRYLGIEGHFRPTTKAHPGLRVADLDAFAERLAAHGAAVVWDDSLPPDRRIYCQDPVGNLLEFVEPRARASGWAPYNTADAA